MVGGRERERGGGCLGSWLQLLLLLPGLIARPPGRWRVLGKHGVYGISYLPPSPSPSASPSLLSPPLSCVFCVVGVGGKGREGKGGEGGFLCVSPFLILGLCELNLAFNLLLHFFLLFSLLSFPVSSVGGANLSPPAALQSAAHRDRERERGRERCGGVV
jgi:hypothetical protein